MPGSKLVNRIKSQCGQTRGPNKGRTKFVEMGGTPITWLFPNKDQFGGNLGCQYREKCFISEKHDCRTAKVVYRIECNTCVEMWGTPITIKTNSVIIWAASTEKSAS